MGWNAGRKVASVLAKVLMLPQVTHLERGAVAPGAVGNGGKVKAKGAAGAVGVVHNHSNVSVAQGASKDVRRRRG